MSKGIDSQKVKRYFIKTLGCQANERDSEQAAGIFEALGLLPAKSFSSADVFLINSCSVRQKAEDKAYGYGREVLRKRKAGRKRMIVIMAGCLVGSAKGKRKRIKLGPLERRLSWVDYFISPSEIRELPSILLDAGVISEMDIRISDPNKFDIAKRGNHAYVNISTGCDNFCAFCVVPYARGEEVSRSGEDIIKECKHLVKLGYSHITLVGQNVNSWGLPKDIKFKIRAGEDRKLPFADLLRSVHEISGVKKISFISSNPFDFTADLIDALALPKVDRYLHMAVQSGDDEVLKRMNRRHTVEEFKRLVRKIREKVPDIEIGTDIIVGFPGETEDQCENTIKLCKEIRFANVYLAMYSPREGTAAQKLFKDDIPKKVKKKRHARLTKVIEESKLK